MGGPDWIGISACVILAGLFLLGIITVSLMVIDWEE